MNNRIKTVDAARGIAILLVILGHCCYSLDEPINKVILSFHMPLFFFISGLIAKTYVTKRGGGYFLNKLKMILLPQITLGVISYIYDLLFTVALRKGAFTDVDFFYCIWRWWFLPVLFVVTILFYYLSKFLDYGKLSVRVGVILTDGVLIILMTYIVSFPDETPFYLNVVPMAFLFYFAGYMLKPIIHKELGNKQYGLIMIVAIVLLILFSQMNSYVTMYNNNYGNIGIFFMCCICGIYVIWYIADKLKNVDVLNWIGKNSIIIYVWQFKLAEFYKNIAEIVVGKVHVLYDDLVRTLIAFLLVIVTVIPIIIISNKYFPFIYGKSRTKANRSNKMN